MSDESNEDINKEDPLRRAMASIKNIGPETRVNEETYIFVPTQELLPTTNGEDNGNSIPDFVDDMPDALQFELTVQLENVGGQWIANLPLVPHSVHEFPKKLDKSKL